MKHEQAFRRILSEMHEPWMDADDRSEFDSAMIDALGSQVDANIETGISNGLTPLQQAEIVRSLLRAMR